jgi:hypothetical protein
MLLQVKIAPKKPKVSQKYVILTNHIQYARLENTDEKTVINNLLSDCLCVV